jgi:DNA polymerase-3 subunit epsilon
VIEICLDTETTGLSREVDRIVEIGCVEIKNTIPTGRILHLYIDPRKPMPREAEAIHGLSDDFLRGKPLFRQIAREFLDFIGDYPLVIHNAPFDVGMINAELARLSAPPLSNPIVDTLLLSRKVRPGKSHKLDAICNHYKIDISKRTKHGALLDCELLASVYRALQDGGQTKMADLLVEGQSQEVQVEVAIEDIPPRVFKSRLSLGERIAHRKFIQALPAEAVWLSYEPYDRRKAPPTES